MKLYILKLVNIDYDYLSGNDAYCFDSLEKAQECEAIVGPMYSDVSIVEVELNK